MYYTHIHMTSILPFSLSLSLSLYVFKSTAHLSRRNVGRASYSRGHIIADFFSSPRSFVLPSFPFPLCLSLSCVSFVPFVLEFISMCALLFSFPLLTRSLCPIFRCSQTFSHLSPLYRRLILYFLFYCIYQWTFLPLGILVSYKHSVCMRCNLFCLLFISFSRIYLDMFSDVFHK